MNTEEDGAEIYKRLHTSAIRGCCNLAWLERAQKIQLSHVDSQITVTETSKKYLDHLMAETEPFLMPSVRYDIEGKEKVAQKIQKESGIADVRGLYQGLRRTMRYKDLTKWTQELTTEGRVKMVNKKLVYIREPKIK